jgi:PAS domain S-box-containing protein
MAASLNEAGKRSAFNILLVDDQRAKLLSYEAILKDLDENLISVTTADEALSVLLKMDIAVVLVDVCMPDLDGFQLVQMIREHPRFKDIAVIFVSAVLSSDFDRIKGYEFGAVDYVSVPVVPEILRAKVRVFIELHRKARELEQTAMNLEQIVAERTAELEDSTAQLKKREEQLSQALAAANMGTWRHDLGSQISTADADLNAILGFERAETSCPTSEWFARIHEDDVEAVAASWRRAVSERGRYEAETRFRKPDGSIRWIREQGNYVPGPNGMPGYLTGLALDITERRQAEEARNLLIEELNHRVKNMLAMVQSIAVQSLTDDTQKDRFLPRIQALATGHNLLTRTHWKGASLAGILHALFKPYGIDKSRLRLVGHDIILSSRDSITVSLAVHELLTNAVKYGAYAHEVGAVDMNWAVEVAAERPILVLSWRESGFSCARPGKTGFGTKLLTSLAAQPGGRFCCDYSEEGVHCELAFPLERVSR